MIELRTPAEIDEMRPAGRFVASVLTATRAAADASELRASASCAPPTSGSICSTWMHSRTT